MKIDEFSPYLYGADTPEGRFDGLPIVDDKGSRVWFRPNEPQEYALSVIRDHQAERPDDPVRVVVLKNRQVGFSTFFLVLMVAYAHRYAHRECYVVAQLEKTAKVLHERSVKMWEALYHRTMKKGTTKSVIFPHPDDSTSFLRTDTANSLKGGRGPTAHALHLTEASRYPQDSTGTFASAVSWNPDTMILIETTANGKSGQGEDYYKLYMSAKEGRNGYLPIFIPWTMDKKCRIKVAKDFTLIDEEEERLHYEVGLDLEQIAFRRFKIEGDMAGNASQFSQEFPLDEESAFLSSGTPVFYFNEIKAVSKTIKPPLQEGIFDIDPSSAKYMRFLPKKGGYVRIWEAPSPECRYYIGADSAKCEDEESDFAAAVLWNGSDKSLAARIAARIEPVDFASILNLLGRWYNCAMLNVELTGGWGNHVQQLLKDEWGYPNLYRWKGKNDRVKGGISNSYGWETTHRSRQDMMSVFKGSIREDDLLIRDEALLVQMENAEQEFGRWDVRDGHDDILMAAMIGWMARFHYPPPVFSGSRHKILDTSAADRLKEEATLSPDPAYESLQKHVNKLSAKIRTTEKRFQKMGGSGANKSMSTKKII